MTVWQMWCRLRGHAHLTTWYAPWRYSTSLRFRSVTKECHRCGTIVDRDFEEQPL